MDNRYTYAEVLADCLTYFNGDTLAASTWIGKYCLRDKDGLYCEKTPKDMHRRMAKEFARMENKFGNKNNKDLSKYGQTRKPLTEDTIFEYFDDFKYIVPQGSIMFGCGNKHQTVSLSNCIVIKSPFDSYSGIMYSDQQLVQLMKRRCGVGLDISSLRPEGEQVSNAAGTSTGAVSFMERFSSTTREVGQCIAKGQRVLTESGLKKIEEISIGEKVWTKVGWVSVVNVYKNGRKNIYKTTTTSGFEIKTSEDHFFIKGNEDKTFQECPLNDFSTGEKIGLLIGSSKRNKEYIKLNNKEYIRKNTGGKSSKLAEYKLPENLCEKLAYVLGYSYGDGCIEYDKFNEPDTLSVSCSNEYEEIKNKLKEYVSDVFGYTLSSKDGGGDCENIYISSKFILNFISNNGLMKQKAGFLVFPDLIKKSPVSVQMAFISGYLDADGTISKKKGYVICSIDEAFLKECQVILMSNGIISKIRKEDRSKKGWQDLYSITVTGNFSHKKVMESMDISEKVNIQGFVSKRDTWLTPYTASSLGVEYNNYSYCPDNTQLLSLSCFHRLKTDNAVDGESIVLDNILSIEECGVEETFDLELEKEHLFWCEGFYVHNSGRRGALMITIDIRHPDVEKFITIKKDLSKVTGANISIRLTDEFMKAVEKNQTFDLRFPIDSTNVLKTVNAKDVWENIIASAHGSAEPGLIFWDNQHWYSTSSVYPGFENVSTNPCSEIAMQGGDSCRLVVINLFNCVDNPFTPEAKFNFEKLYEVSYESQRLMDDVVELEVECVNRILQKIEDDPEPDHIKTVEKETWELLKDQGLAGRRTGLGFTALADTMAAIGVKFDSDEAIKVTEQIMKCKCAGEWDSSIDMAIERGKFSCFDTAIEDTSKFIQMLKTELPEIYERNMKYGRRNISISTVAPTGTVSMMTKSSSGIEPVYLLSYMRRKKINPNDKNVRVDFVDDSGDSWMQFEVNHPKFQMWRDVTGLKNIEDSPYYKCTAPEINWLKRIELQGVIQNYVTHSISSTINLPNNVSLNEVSDIYLHSWKHKLKGITVYRDGSRSGVLVKKEDTVKQNTLKREATLACDIHYTNIKGENWAFFIGKNSNGEPYEVFGGKKGQIHIPLKYKNGWIQKVKKANGIAQYDLYLESLDDENNQIIVRDLANVFLPAEGSYTRIISTFMRHGIPMKYVCEQLHKISSKDDMYTFEKGMARVLKKYIKNGETSSMTCTQCGQKGIIYEEGCVKCNNCGYYGCG